jgi:hypothetical protein
MKKSLRIAAAATLSVLVTACASGPSGKSANYPSWVMVPSIEDGIAAAACVPASGNITTDRAQATSQGRVDLAQQINIQVRAMDKTYLDKVETNGKLTSGSTFSQVSRQLTEQSLTGSRVTKAAFANEDKEFCVLVTLGASSTKELFDQIIKQSAAPLSPKDEDILYQEFNAQKAQEEMDKYSGK